MAIMMKIAVCLIILFIRGLLCSLEPFSLPLSVDDALLTSINARSSFFQSTAIQPLLNSMKSDADSLSPLVLASYHGSLAGVKYVLEHAQHLTTDEHIYLSFSLLYESITAEDPQYTLQLEQCLLYLSEYMRTKRTKFPLSVLASLNNPHFFKLNSSIDASTFTDLICFSGAEIESFFLGKTPRAIFNDPFILTMILEFILGSDVNCSFKDILRAILVTKTKRSFKKALRSSSNFSFDEEKFELCMKAAIIYNRKEIVMYILDDLKILDPAALLSLAFSCGHEAIAALLICRLSKTQGMLLQTNLWNISKDSLFRKIRAMISKKIATSSGSVMLDGLKESLVNYVAASMKSRAVSIIPLILRSYKPINDDDISWSSLLPVVFKALGPSAEAENNLKYTPYSDRITPEQLMDNFLYLAGRSYQIQLLEQLMKRRNLVFVKTLHFHEPSMITLLLSNSEICKTFIAVMGLQSIFDLLCDRAKGQLVQVYQILNDS